MTNSTLPEVDGIGPETIAVVADPETGMRGVLVIDSTVLGPAGGGIRMLPDVTIREVAALARAMTYKYTIFGLPRGGCKGGIWGDATMTPETRRGYMRAYGRLLSPFLKPRKAVVGPDMGVFIEDLEAIYAGAEADYPRSGLFARQVDGQPLEFHITGHGVYVAARKGFEAAGRGFEGATVAVEGFGHVGVGVSRYAVKNGARLVAVSTIQGAVHDEAGLNFERLLALREVHGDACVLEYPGGRQIPNTDIYYLPVDLLIPGARPYVITEKNVDRVQAKIISSGSNIPITEVAEQRLFERGILSVPDFVANAGGVLASWVDYLGGDVDQAFRANEKLIGEVSQDILSEALSQRVMPRKVAADRVHARIDEARGKPSPTFEQIREKIRARLGVFEPASAASAQ